MVDLNGPALTPPPGIEPNLVSPPNNNDLVGGVCITCLVIITILVALRCYSRYERKIFLVEDFLMISGYGLFIAWTYLVFRVIHGTGFFVHQWNVPLADITEFTYVSYHSYSYVIFIGSNIYNMCIACVKAALLIEWIRIFVPGHKTRNTFFWCSTMVIVLNTMFYAAATITLNIACTPHQYNWDKFIPGGGHCFDTKRQKLASACINLVSDVTILILPQQIIWRLQMSTRRRLGVSVIFAAGLFGCVTASARVAVTLDYVRSKDATYTISPVVLWAIGEMTSVLVIFCITPLPKLFKENGAWSRLAASFRSWTRIPGPSDDRSQEIPPHSLNRVVPANKTSYHTQIPLGKISNESTQHLQSYSRQV